MMDDFTLITHHFDDTIHVIPIADVHLGALEHDSKAWEEFLQKTVASPNTYVILLGDLLNNSVRGSSFANPFDEVLRPMEAKKMMVEYLKPLAEAGKVLACVSGNHEYRTELAADQNPSYDICAKLNIEHLYRPNMAFVKIGIGHRGKDPRPSVSYTLACIHGNAGGALTGGVLNRNERSASYISGADVFLVGHSHKGILTRPKQIVIDPHNNRVTLQSYLVASAESWLDFGGYAARKMLTPAEHGNPFVLTLNNSTRKGLDKRVEVTW